MKNSIIPVILAGGVGTRLWPLSRESYPKQFCTLIDEKTLFQHTAKRFQNSTELKFKNPIVVTNSEFRFIVSEQLRDVGIDASAILIEPEGKNTAPAVLIACFQALSECEDPIVLICPSDHHIDDVDKLYQCILHGMYALKQNNFVLFSIKPEYPEAGYGYMKLDVSSEDEIFDVVRFVEKPNVDNALKMISDGDYFWNSGIFLMRAKDLVSTMSAQCPELSGNVRQAYNLAEQDLGFTRIESSAWKKCENISIDFALLEGASNLKSVIYNGKWTDLGNWYSVWKNEVKDNAGVVSCENSIIVDCKNSIIRAEDPHQQIVAVGLENLVVVGMSDAVLVSTLERSKDLRQVVHYLKDNNITQSTNQKKDFRPWGWFETLTVETGYQVKRICVNSGEKLSLQSHEHRSEHWVVVSGTAKVTIDDEVSFLTGGQSVYIPVKSLHRLENEHNELLVLIEVQTGDYLGEDDIVRYDDKYSRH